LNEKRRNEKSFGDEVHVNPKLESWEDRKTSAKIEWL